MCMVGEHGPEIHRLVALRVMQAIANGKNGCHNRLEVKTDCHWAARPRHNFAPECAEQIAHREQLHLDVFVSTYREPHNEGRTLIASAAVYFYRSAMEL